MFDRYRPQQMSQKWSLQTCQNNHNMIFWPYHEAFIKTVST